MQLSIIVPAHNEENRIGKMLDAYLPYFTELYGRQVEFLVIINGSTDRTEEIVRHYRTNYPCLNIIVEPNPIGKGGAIMLGFAKAKGRLVGYVDADGATPPRAFQDLAEHIGADDAIIASRWIKGAHVHSRQPLARRIASRIFNFLVNTMFGVHLHDTQCGAKLLRKRAADTILPRLGLTRWAFDVDLIYQLRRAGYSITERPTTWSDVTGSKLNVTKASFEMFLAICRLRLLFSPFKWIVSVYDHLLGRTITIRP